MILYLLPESLGDKFTEKRSCSLSLSRFQGADPHPEAAALQIPPMLHEQLQGSLQQPGTFQQPREGF